MESSRQDVFTINADCDLTSVDDLLGALKQQVGAATPDNPLALDLTPGRPTAVALQLAVSAARSLGQRAAFAGFGATAAQFLPHVIEN